jgi:catechol 2,3-dioxygenase-like lactoylglutathione lyase family enzyme
MDLRLELVLVPVSDADRAKDFYAGRLDFRVDRDETFDDAHRVVQLTPPGSACSIAIQTSRPSAPVHTRPGSLQGLCLLVTDLPAAHSLLAERGIPVSSIQVSEGGGFRPAEADEAAGSAGCAFFKDPDGNGWVLRQLPREEEP